MNIAFQVQLNYCGNQYGNYLSRGHLRIARCISVLNYYTALSCYSALD